jgi:hypothetical protein
MSSWRSWAPWACRGPPWPAAPSEAWKASAAPRPPASAWRDSSKKAEEDFVQQARQQGLETVAQWVASLPVQNLPTFRQALESLRTHWDEGELTERLAQEFARLPGVPKKEQARALALYLACLRARLLADENLRPVVVALSTLRTEAGVERLLEAVDALYGAVNRLLGLPEDLVAWPVQTLSEIAELRADLLLPAYRLVPYTGRPSRKRRRTSWPGRGDWRRPGRRWDCAPTSARAARARPAC